MPRNGPISGKESMLATIIPSMQTNNENQQVLHFIAKSAIYNR